VAAVIRSPHPDLKRSVKAAIPNIATDQKCEELLMCELDGLWKYRVRRFRIVYTIDRKERVIRLIAVGHRQSIYEDRSAKLRTKSEPAYTILTSRRRRLHLSGPVSYRFRASGYYQVAQPLPQRSLGSHESS
jgi:mRNA interferase RelE/StbE